MSLVMLIGCIILHSLAHPLIHPRVIAGR